ncbi:hypothetical protein ACETU7_06940 [Rhodococcus sp. 3Y1]
MLSARRRSRITQATAIGATASSDNPIWTDALTGETPSLDNPRWPSAVSTNVQAVDTAVSTDVTNTLVSKAAVTSAGMANAIAPAPPITHSKMMQTASSAVGTNDRRTSVATAFGSRSTRRSEGNVSTKGTMVM